MFKRGEPPERRRSRSPILRDYNHRHPISSKERTGQSGERHHSSHRIKTSRPEELQCDESVTKFLSAITAAAAQIPLLAEVVNAAKASNDIQARGVASHDEQQGVSRETRDSNTRYSRPSQRVRSNSPHHSRSPHSKQLSSPARMESHRYHNRHRTFRNKSRSPRSPRYAVSRLSQMPVASLSPQRIKDAQITRSDNKRYRSRSISPRLVQRSNDHSRIESDRPRRGQRASPSSEPRYADLLQTDSPYHRDRDQADLNCQFANADSTQSPYHDSLHNDRSTGQSPVRSPIRVHSRHDERPKFRRGRCDSDEYSASRLADLQHQDTLGLVHSRSSSIQRDSLRSRPSKQRSPNLLYAQPPSPRSRHDYRAGREREIGTRRHGSQSRRLSPGLITLSPRPGESRPQTDSHQAGIRPTQNRVDSPRLRRHSSRAIKTNGSQLNKNSPQSRTHSLHTRTHTPEPETHHSVTKRDNSRTLTHSTRTRLDCIHARKRSSPPREARNMYSPQARSSSDSHIKKHSDEPRENDSQRKRHTPIIFRESQSQQIGPKCSRLPYACINDQSNQRVYSRTENRSSSVCHNMDRSLSHKGREQASAQTMSHAKRAGAKKCHEKEQTVSVITNDPSSLGEDSHEKETKSGQNNDIEGTGLFDFESYPQNSSGILGPSLLFDFDPTPDKKIEETISVTTLKSGKRLVDCIEASQKSLPRVKQMIVCQESSTPYGVNQKMAMAEQQALWKPGTQIFGPEFDTRLPGKEHVKGEVETDEEVLLRRQKNIDFGKNDPDYEFYRKSCRK